MVDIIANKKINAKTVTIINICFTSNLLYINFNRILRNGEVFASNVQNLQSKKYLKI